MDDASFVYLSTTKLHDFINPIDKLHHTNRHTHVSLRCTENTRIGKAVTTSEKHAKSEQNQRVGNKKPRGFLNDSVIPRNVSARRTLLKFGLVTEKRRELLASVPCPEPPYKTIERWPPQGEDDHQARCSVLPNISGPSYAAGMTRYPVRERQREKRAASYHLRSQSL